MLSAKTFYCAKKHPNTHTHTHTYTHPHTEDICIYIDYIYKYTYILTDGMSSGTASSLSGT